MRADPVPGAAHAGAAARPRVLFVQKYVPHYREPFFEALRAALDRAGIDLALVHGEPDRADGARLATVSPGWALPARSRRIGVGSRTLHWIGALGHVRRGDVVVTEHAVKILDNYPLYLLGRLGIVRFCYFGHGANFQGEGEGRITAGVRRALVGPVERWFAYTEASRGRLLEQGIAPSRITVVDNALADPGPREAGGEGGAGETAGPEPARFVYAGGLYAEKRLDFLVEAGDELARRLPTFRLDVVGDGPERGALEAAAAERPWLRVLGARYGESLERTVRAARAILMPGAVGLVVIDAFRAERPLVTTGAGRHGPEIAYLEHGVNGVIAGPGFDVRAYADAVQRLVEDAPWYERLQDGCRIAAARYTLSNMVSRFVAGLERAAGR